MIHIQEDGVHALVNQHFFSHVCFETFASLGSYSGPFNHDAMLRGNTEP